MKGIITIILLIAFVAVLMLFDLPAYNKVGFLRSEIKKYEEFVKEKEELIVKVNQLKQIYESREDKINKVYYVLPPGTDIPNLIVQFEALASENGLILGSLNFVEKKAVKTAGKVTWGGGTTTTAPGSESQKAYENMNISLSLSGSYQSFKSFLKALEYNIRLMDIKSISFSSTETEGKEEEEEEEIPTYTFDVSLEVYYQ